MEYVISSEKIAVKWTETTCYDWTFMTGTTDLKSPLSVSCA